VTTEPIRVLVVDDDFRVAGLHASYVGSLPDFEVVGRAHSAADALRAAEELVPDLVLLDEYLPDGSGSALIGRLGAAVIMVSAASDAGVVRRALAAGAVNYVLKPFPPTELLDRLQAFRRFWTLLDGGPPVDQTLVDRALQSMRSGDSPVAAVRKGRSAVTSESIADVLRRSAEAVTALEVAEATGVSRATAQRYLSDLARDGRVRLTLRYGSTGRPEHRFEWVG
jgi:two-component system CitB family response regulator